MNFSGKEGHPNIQPSTRPRVEPGTSGFGGRDLTTGPTPPLYSLILENVLCLSLVTHNDPVSLVPPSAFSSVSRSLDAFLDANLTMKL